MNTLFCAFLIIFFSQMAPAQMTNSEERWRLKPDYYGAQNQEATYRLIFDLLIFTAKNEITLKDVEKEIGGVSKFILGQMRRTPENPAASYPKYTFDVLKTTQETDGVIRATIQLNGKGVFRKNLTSYSFYIPLAPSKLWTDSKGLCSPENGVDAGNFWYHWEPRLPNCPLVLGVHYSIVTTQLYYQPNSYLTFPDYKNFDLDQGTLKATYMFGLESYTDTDWDANTSPDWGALWYRQTRDFMMSEFGFKKRAWTDAEIAELIGYQKPVDGKNWPTIEDLTLDTRKGRIRFRLFLGVTGIHNESTAFHHILADSLFKENVVMYSGHSGIGKNVDLHRIEKLRGFSIPLSRSYQIYFWGGCVPYSYYTDLFFSRKQNLLDPQGTRNLDIIAYGNESVFTADDDTRLISALVKYMKGEKRTSYQEIIGDQDRYFLGVSGDEDNPTDPIKNFSSKAERLRK